jgi:hypothetical protein
VFAGLVVGLVLAWRPLTFAEFRRLGAAPLAILLGGPLFFLIAGLGRAVTGSESALGTRFVYIGAAALVPALGVAANAFVVRWRWTALVAVPLLLVGVPFNIDGFSNYFPEEEYFSTQREMILGFTGSPLADGLSDSVRPDPSPFGSPGLTLGWLRSAEAGGRLPEVGEPSELVQGLTAIRLSLVQTEEPPPEGTTCRTYREPLDLTMKQGQQVGLESALYASLVTDDGSALTPPVLVQVQAGQRMTAMRDDVRVRFRAAGLFPEFTLCT